MNFRKVSAFGFVFFSVLLWCQCQSVIHSTIDLASFKPNSKQNIWLKISENALGTDIVIPVIILKGDSDKPVLGITAAIHGDEINGTSIIHHLTDKVDVNKLKGTIVAFPVLNPEGYLLNQRDDINQEDLNRIFPGKAAGTESEQFVYQLKDKVLKDPEFLIDIHTASFGRINSMYVRADLTNDTLATFAALFQPDVILDSKEASVGIITSASKTLRQEATDKGIRCITLEAGNPQVLQSDMISRGTSGILRIMSYLKMLPEATSPVKSKPLYCKKSYWVYTTKGGILEVMPGLNQVLKKGDLIAVQKDIFGNISQKYFSPEDGVVIGKSTNPVAGAGGRILHLGILR